MLDKGVKHPASGIGGSSYQTRATTDGHVVLNLATNSTVLLLTFVSVKMHDAGLLFRLVGFELD